MLEIAAPATDPQGLPRRALEAREHRLSDKETPMIAKLSVLGFSLATAIASPALAHDRHDSGHDRHGRSDYRGDHRGDYRAASAEVDLRHADLNRDGYVTLQEALDSGRQVFRRQDRNNDWTLTRHEVGQPGIRHDDRNNDGRVSMREYQRRVRAQFARMDINRDGYLGRRELGYGPRGTRPAGWNHR
jgi:hypothetical protein